MAELQELGVRVVEISASASEMVFTMELNFERDKNGDVCKLHNTYIILWRSVLVKINIIKWHHK